ncbi:MAG: hypothetical protein M5U28_54125 [Sandaracinaceae bacterium]|nr:hypothetical protein [Sandaracinaceae bacterium]
MKNTHDKPRFNFRLYALAVQMVAALAAGGRRDPPAQPGPR